MGVSNIWLPLTFKAAEALDTEGHEGVVITIADNKVANDGQEATGVLMSKPKSGEHGTLALHGIVKARAGGTIAANNTITTATSGYITVTASDSFINGRALEAITSGSLGKVFWHGANQYQVSSIDG